MAGRKNLGSPAGRLLALSLETNVPEPYVVSDLITIPVPTKRVAEKMAAAEMERFLAQIALNQAYGRSQRPKPPEPVQSGDGDEDAVAAHAEAVTAWEADCVAWDEMQQASQDDTQAMAKRITAADTEYNEAFFGGQYQNVVAFFDEQPRQLWEAFVTDIQSWFNPKSTPDDGVCAGCGQVVDEEAAGKAPTS